MKTLNEFLQKQHIADSNIIIHIGTNYINDKPFGCVVINTLKEYEDFLSKVNINNFPKFEEYDIKYRNLLYDNENSYLMLTPNDDAGAMWWSSEYCKEKYEKMKFYKTINILASDFTNEYWIKQGWRKKNKFII